MPITHSCQKTYLSFHDGRSWHLTNTWSISIEGLVLPMSLGSKISCHFPSNSLLQHVHLNAYLQCSWVLLGSKKAGICLLNKNPPAFHRLTHMPQSDQYLPQFEHRNISHTWCWKALEQLIARHDYFSIWKAKIINLGILFLNNR